MTESGDVSIDEVRALVAERQRYDDWLTALDAKREETPSRVFERVYGDYVARRREVMTRLRAHVGGLSAVKDDLEGRLTALVSHLGALEDDRAEAMLRTAVGEYDGDRWEQVRQDVESQIAELSEQRVSLSGEVDEVRNLLTHAQSGQDADEPAAIDEPASIDELVADAAATAMADASADEPTVGASFVEHAPFEPVDLTEELVSSDAMAPAATLSTATESTSARESIESTSPMPDETADAVASIMPVDPNPFGLMDGASARPTAPETDDAAQAEMDHALSVFSGDATASYKTTPISTATSGLPTGLDGVDVFDDSELGDLRMSPPSRGIATATPPASPVSGTPGAHTTDAGRDGFDDLAFLRSVVDPSAGAGVRGPASAEQQKTLRCTECGTMNFPTEWYCERCGGELAAF